MAESHDFESSQLPVWRAVITGWLIVNVPVIIIMLSVLLSGLALAPNEGWIFLSIAFFLGWIWWSFTIPRWRRWALRRGADPDKLQRWAVMTGLVWRKGSRFEKTEFRSDD